MTALATAIASATIAADEDPDHAVEGLAVLLRSLDRHELESTCAALSMLLGVALTTSAGWADIQGLALEVAAR